MTNNNKKGNLYLIPAPLGDIDLHHVIPSYITDIINTIDEFIVEDERTARRYLKKIGLLKPLEEIVFHLLNTQTNFLNVAPYLNATTDGKHVGVLSDAGCPGIADPGAEVVKIAHQKSIRVIPLVGPSSILLALMASGMNGQNFVFHGYLPKERNERVKKIKEIEKAAQQKDQTQIFIETPYRNQHILEDIIHNCNAQTQLCIARDLTLPFEYINTKTISEWKNKLPDVSKKQCVFLLYK